MMCEFEITLGIEAAIEGGSISLFRGMAEIGSWISTDKQQRSEEILVKIDEILVQNAIRIDQVNRIVISTGPGSYTGLKVGIATALGLKTSLGIPCEGISILRAMSLINGRKAEIRCAVLLGRSHVARQTFSNGLPLTNPSMVAESEFVSEVASETATTFILHESLYQMLATRHDSSEIKLINAGRNLAHLTVRAVRMGAGQSALEPIFVTNPHGRK